MERRERILIALAFAGAASVIAYAAARVVERVSFPEPNPAALIWSERSNFIWRALVALYCGGLGAFGGYALAAAAPRASARGLGIAILVAALAIILVAVIAP